jgi:Protein of unknown function (DUF3311)
LKSKQALLSTRTADFDKQDWEISSIRRRLREQAEGGNMKLALLFAPCVLALWAPLYNATQPVLFGFPFFYWFQLLLVPISALTIFAADRFGRD